jgi:hypothetical protein
MSHFKMNIERQYFINHGLYGEINQLRQDKTKNPAS